MLASSGLATPPWGVPRVLLLPPPMRRVPSLSSRSSIGAFSHSLISRNTPRSTMRRATDFRSSSCGGVDHVGVAPAYQPAHFFDRVHRSADGAVAVDIILEVRLEDWFQHEFGGSLHHPI